ncbi:MAG: DnaJ domain-containing protein [Nitrosopumilus sp.]|jgi:molecular chaperone DnaJ|nr:DnaJ domain-containing protein [Nitrosopumilus sp.]MDH3853178.1 DnaJ domain-containing protein [Nitrosopumilus sp.]
MNRFWIFVISIIVFGGMQYANAQNDNLDMDLEVTDEEKIMLFSGFAVAVIAIVLFLARDIILRRKTSYDKEDLESKKDKTFEKYHSDWGDDYEELGQRKNTKEDKEFREAANNDELPNYYDVIGVSKDATPDEIKKKFRELAMKTHPDKTKEDSENEMAELNKAYEILSDKERREKYDRYLKVD